MVNKLKFWCQKVLPLVYDDSLSYYELLCKVVAKLNELVEFINTLPDSYKDLILNYLNQFLSSAFMECVYIKESETIRLSFTIPKSDTTSHYYENNQLVIEIPKVGE